MLAMARAEIHRRRLRAAALAPQAGKNLLESPVAPVDGEKSHRVERHALAAAEL